jgi:antitoxin HicB
MAETAAKTTKPAAKSAAKRPKKARPVVYTVVVTREKDGRYVVCAPALNDCGSYGDTLPEALQHAEVAIALYLDGQRRHGWPIPPDDPQVCIDMTGLKEVTVHRLTIREEQVLA